MDRDGSLTSAPASVAGMAGVELLVGSDGFEGSTEAV